MDHYSSRRSGYRGQQQQRQHGSGSLPGMDTRPSALRMALQGGGGDIARRGSEASAYTNDPHHPQQRRRGGSGDEGRRRGSTTTNAGSWEFCEPAQPRGSSPVSRPPSVRQRQGELNISQSRGTGRACGDNTTYEAQAFESRGSVAGRETTSGGRAAAPGNRDGVADASMASFGRGGIGGGKGRAAAQTRSSVRAAGGNVGSNCTTGACRVTSLAESSSTTTTTTSSRRGSGGAVRGNNRGSANNQAEDTMPPGSTPRRLSSSSGRATSCPSDSPYQDRGFHRADVGSSGLSNSRGGGCRINRKGELDDRSTDSAFSRRLSCDGAGGKRRESSQHDRAQGDSGGGGPTRGSPSTAPSGSISTELDRRLPSIEGLDINGPVETPGGGRAGGQGDEESMTPPSSSSLMRQRRAKDSPGNSGGSRFSSVAAAEQCLPAPGVLGDEASGQHCSSNNTEDRREGGGKEHAGVGASESSGGSRLDHAGYNNSGGLVAPGDSSSGGDVALQARRMVGTSGGAGGSLRKNDQMVGRTSNNCTTDGGGNIENSLKSSNVRSNCISRSRECLVGLQNLGNTCFMNACLQCLLHTDALVGLFRRRLHHEQRLSSHNNESPTRGALAEAFRELVALVEASPAHSNVSPAQVF